MDGMSHVIQGTNRWLATAWIALTDVTGTGESVAQSGLIGPGLSTLPPFVDLLFEISFDQQRTGGTGNVQTWLQLLGMQGAVTVADAAAAPPFYTGKLLAADTKFSRSIRVKPAVVQGDGVVAISRLSGRLRANGSAADTEFAVTNIKYRLCYVPL